MFSNRILQYNRAYKFPYYRAGEVALQVKVMATMPDYLSYLQKFVTNRSPQFYVTRNSTENSAFYFSVAIQQTIYLKKKQ